MFYFFLNSVLVKKLYDRAYHIHETHANILIFFVTQWDLFQAQSTIKYVKIVSSHPESIKKALSKYLLYLKKTKICWPAKRQK